MADAICGYYKILAKGQPSEAYNIGVEKPEISMAELAGKILALGCELFGYTGKVVRQESADGDYLLDNPLRRCPVIEKARRDLGFNPSVSIDDGLRRAMIWYGDNRVAEDS